MASNVATLGNLCALPLAANLASMKSMVADNSIQIRWGGARRRMGIQGFGGVLSGWGAGA